MKEARAFYFRDHLMLLTEKEPQKPHRHLASHLVLAPDGEMEWTVAGETVRCRGIYIDGNVEHVCRGGGRFVVFLFVKTSDYACSTEQTLLRGRPYAVLDARLAEDARALLEACGESPPVLDEKLLALCRFSKASRRRYDPRVEAAIRAVEAAETIDGDTIASLLRQVCLSQSRFSHLFKEETGMTLAGYFAFEKQRKTYRYLLTGKSITESCVLAGFDSPSHCAASCNRMFGLSLRKIAAV